jgi:hypothetical protein
MHRTWDYYRYCCSYTHRHSSSCSHDYSTIIIVTMWCIVTWPCTWMSVPASMSISAMATWPLHAAFIRAVSPSCVSELWIGWVEWSIRKMWYGLIYFQNLIRCIFNSEYKQVKVAILCVCAAWVVGRRWDTGASMEARRLGTTNYCSLRNLHYNTKRRNIIKMNNEYEQ